MSLRLARGVFLSTLCVGAVHAQSGPVFTSETLPEVLTDVGAMSAPASGDFDADGDLDLVVGTAIGTLVYFRNDAGAGASPIYAQQTGVDNPFDGINVGYAAAPAAGDWDGDTDTDLFIGQGDGTLVYLDNAAGIFTVGATPAAFSDLGFNAVPASGDLTGDGRTDLVVGEMEGTLRLYSNVSIPGTLAFVEATGGADPFAGVDVGFSSAPALGDWDQDGDLDVISGDADGGFWALENTAGAGNPPAFAAPEAMPYALTDVGHASVPLAGDFNADGVVDLLIGEGAGSYWFFQNQGQAAFALQLTGAEGYRALALPMPDLPLGGRTPGFLTSLFTAGYVKADIDQRNVRGLATVFAYDEPTAGYPRIAFDNPVRFEDQSPLGHGRGLWVFVFEDDKNDEPGIQGGFPKPLFAVGCTVSPCTALSTDFDFALSYTPASPSPGSNLLGNPFDQDLSWDAPGWTKTDVSNTIEIWDPEANSGAGGFLTWDGTTGTLGNGIIPTGQAFLVTATAETAALTAPASARTGTRGPLYGIVGEAPEAPQEADKAVRETAAIAFSLSSASGEASAFVTVRSSASLGADTWDSPLREGVSQASGVRLAALSTKGAALTHAAIPRDLDAPVTVALHAEALAAGVATDATAVLAWTPTDLPDGWSAVLVDATTGQRYDLTTPGTTSLGLDAADALLPAPPEAKAADRAAPPSTSVVRIAGDKAASSARFSVQIGPGSLVASGGEKNAEVSTVGALGPNPARTVSSLSVSLASASDVRVVVYDALGRRVATAFAGPLSEGPHRITLPVSQLATGVYTVRVEGIGEVTARRLTVTR